MQYIGGGEETGRIRSKKLAEEREKKYVSRKMSFLANLVAPLLMTGRAALDVVAETSHGGGG
jgi:hypothetical protein